MTRPILLAGLGSAIAHLIVGEVLTGFNTAVAQGATWLLGQIGHALMTTGPQLGAPWFSRNYQGMVTLSAMLLLPLLLGAVVQALINQDVRQLVRSALVFVPLAIILTGAAVELVQLGSSAVDAMSSRIASHTTSDLSLLMRAITLENRAGVAPAFVVFGVLLILTFGAFLLWLELVVRAAAIEVTVLFLPLVLAGLIWPATARLSRRLAETIAALVLSKLVMVGVISLAADAIVQPGKPGMGSLLQGTAMLFLATLSPFAVLRLLPVIEAGAVGHLEGAGRRMASTVVRPIRRAGSMAIAGLSGGASALPAVAAGAGAQHVGSGLPGGLDVSPVREGGDRPPLATIGGGGGPGAGGGGGPGGGGRPVGGGPVGGGPVGAPPEPLDLGTSPPQGGHSTSPDWEANRGIAY
ncbi:MAG: hypothetical protein ACRDY2_07615 [Acidimicrobiales bacterium]